MNKCSKCKGKGIINDEKSVSDYGAIFPSMEICPDCHGAGFIQPVGVGVKEVVELHESARMKSVIEADVDGLREKVEVLRDLVNMQGKTIAEHKEMIEELVYVLGITRGMKETKEKSLQSFHEHLERLRYGQPQPENKI